MTNDEILEDPAYFNRKFDPDKVESREQLKARRELVEAQKPDERPDHGRKLLQRIISDPSESRSAKQDAQRLLDIAEIRPRDFPAEYDNFLAWYAEHK